MQKPRFLLEKAGLLIGGVNDYLFYSSYIKIIYTNIKRSKDILIKPETCFASNIINVCNVKCFSVICI